MRCLFFRVGRFDPGVRKANLLDLDPVAVSARLSRRPATIRKQWVRPCELLLQQAEDLN